MSSLVSLSAERASFRHALSPVRPSWASPVRLSTAAQSYPRSVRARGSWRARKPEGWRQGGRDLGRPLISPARARTGGPRPNELSGPAGPPQVGSSRSRPIIILSSLSVCYAFVREVVGSTAKPTAAILRRSQESSDPLRLPPPYPCRRPWFFSPKNPPPPPPPCPILLIFLSSFRPTPGRFSFSSCSRPLMSPSLRGWPSYRELDDDDVGYRDEEGCFTTRWEENHFSQRRSIGGLG